MTQYQSRRARILSRVLDYVNAGAWWAEEHGLLVFGDKEAVDCCLKSRPGEAVSTEAVKEAQSLRSRIIASRGRRTAARRVTVGTLPPEWTKADLESWLLGLDPAKREEVVKYVHESVSACRIDPETGSALGREEDNLDAALAMEMLEHLERSVSKTKAYQELRVQHASPWVQQYFQEAHRCYIFGLEVACAVLCRSLLEAVLADLVDPAYRLRRNGSAPHQSHLSNMIEAAKGTILVGKAAASAEMIRDAGNSAIHDLKTFRETHAPQLGTILEDTRQILSQLYK